MDAPGNIVAASLWKVANNTTTTTVDIVSNRATLTYKATIGVNSFAEKFGRTEGGWVLYETARSAHNWLNA